MMNLEVKMVYQVRDVSSRVFIGRASDGGYNYDTLFECLEAIWAKGKAEREWVITRTPEREWDEMEEMGLTYPIAIDEVMRVFDGKPVVYQVREFDNDEDGDDFAIITDKEGRWRFSLEGAECIYDDLCEEHYEARIKLVRVKWSAERCCDDDDEIEIVRNNYL